MPDKWNKTPLHYAAARSATISTLYILQRGAQLEGKDIYGNTALGIALMNRHFNYGIILIQKGADVKIPIYKEFPKRVARDWRLEEKLQKMQSENEGQLKALAQEDAEMVKDEDKSHRDLFFQKKRFSSLFPWFTNLWRLLDEEAEENEAEDSSDESEGSEMEVDVYNN